MKKHLNFAKPLVTRLLLAVMLLAVLGSALVGCGGTTQSTISVSVSDIQYDETVNSLSKLEMEAVAEFLAGNTSAREAFVAAYRGYDMTEKDFDLEADRPALEPSTSAAINVLLKFDEKSKLTSVDYTATGSKCFTITVTDPALIEKTGGIVQGMSGSPLVQNGKLIGAVTHVLINDPTSGYGIFIENMIRAVEAPMAKAS